MADDLDNKITQIAEILGQDKIPDNVKGIISSLISKSQANTNNQVKSEEFNQSRTNGSDESVDMVRKIKLMMDTINSNNDPRISLLKAIRPFLNKNRQKKVHNCIKFLHLSSITRMIDDHDK